MDRSPESPDEETHRDEHQQVLGVVLQPLEESREEGCGFAEDEGITGYRDSHQSFTTDQP